LVTRGGERTRTRLFTPIQAMHSRFDIIASGRGGNARHYQRSTEETSVNGGRQLQLPAVRFCPLIKAPSSSSRGFNSGPMQHGAAWFVCALVGIPSDQRNLILFPACVKTRLPSKPGLWYRISGAMKSIRVSRHVNSAVLLLIRLTDVVCGSITSSTSPDAKHPFVLMPSRSMLDSTNFAPNVAFIALAGWT